MGMVLCEGNSLCNLLPETQNYVVPTCNLNIAWKIVIPKVTYTDTSLPVGIRKHIKAIVALYNYDHEHCYVIAKRNWMLNNT